MKKIASISIIIILIGVLVFSGWSCIRQIGVKPIKLTVWGVFDTKASWDGMMRAYSTTLTANQKNPVDITFVPMVIESYKEYEDQFNESLRNGTGPDIVAINSAWLPRFKGKIIPINNGVAQAQNFQRAFVDVVSNDLMEGTNIYAVPVSVDTLALYYNIDLLNAVDIFDPPRTWDEFSDDARKLTVRDEKGNIKRAGAAIGTSNNVAHSADILSLLMFQSGSAIVDKSQMAVDFTKSAQDNGATGGGNKTIGGAALQFYTDYANSDKVVYTWTPLMENSIDAFSKGDVAMMIDYSYDISTIKSKNYKLRFAVSPVPQIRGAITPVNYADYWAYAVSAGSAHPNEAKDFLMFIVNSGLNKSYITASAKPVAYRDLVSWQAGGEDLNLAVFAEQSLTARSWFQKDNFAAESILNNAIESVVQNRSTAEDAAEIAASQLNRIMKK